MNDKMHQYSGSTIEEALQLATAELGRDLTVVRARRVSSKRTLGFGSKVRFEVDVLAGNEAPMVASNSSDGEFGGVLAGLIDNIERLEADQHRGPSWPAEEREHPGRSEIGPPARSAFGDADLASGAGQYRTNTASPTRPADRAASTAGQSRIDLRSPRSEVDDEVLASLAGRPPRRSAADDLTPVSARLARAAIAPAGVADQGAPGGATTRGDVRAVRPARMAAATIPMAGASADALARAARKAAERAASGRVGGLLAAGDERDWRGDASTAGVQPVAERLLAEHLEVERLKAERVLVEAREAAEEAQIERGRVEEAEAEATEIRRRLDAEREVAEAWLVARETELASRSSQPVPPRSPMSGWSRRARPTIDEGTVEAEWVSSHHDIDQTPAIVDLAVDDAAEIVLKGEAGLVIELELEPKRPPLVAEGPTKSARSRPTRRRLRGLSHREPAFGVQDHNQPVPADIAIGRDTPNSGSSSTKRSAGLMSSLGSARGVVDQPVGRVELTSGVLSFGLDEPGSTELALGGEPGWSLENLAAMAFPPVALEALGRLDLRADADWMSAVELFIREHVPAPVSRAIDSSGVFLSGSDANSAPAIIRAGLLGFVPGYIFVDGQFRLATSIELMLAIRTCLPR